jgi:hypothetical protein
LNVINEAREVRLMVLYPFFAAFRKLLGVVGGVLHVFVAAWALDSIDTCIEK